MGLEEFKKRMEIPERYSMGSLDCLLLEPKSAHKAGDVLALTAKIYQREKSLKVELKVKLMCRISSLSRYGKGKM